MIRIALAFAFALCSLTTTSFAAPYGGRVIRMEDQTMISFDTMVQELSKADMVIMGEKHYTTEVQVAEARIIGSVVRHMGRQQKFTTAWEFLNFSSQETTQRLFQAFVAGEITAQQFLDHTQGPGGGAEYAPVLEVTKELGGELLGVNLPRSDKSPIVKGGLAAAKPGTIPPGFEMGSAGYRERFFELMGSGGHASQQQIANYYDAQCLTDDVMAFNMVNKAAQTLKFLVVGSFHTDFRDGTVGRLVARAPSQKTLVVRIIDTSDYAEGEIPAAIVDEKYGRVADYVLFVNEPSANPAFRAMRLIPSGIEFFRLL